MDATVSSRRLTRTAARAAGVLLAVVIAAGDRAAADTAELTTVRDNTMYSESARSNGVGRHFFAGRTDSGNTRRGLIAFEVAGAVPGGSTITAVTLQLYMSRTSANLEPVILYRVLADWGEGTSNAPGEEGGGAPAADGDATWIYRFYDTADPPAAPMWATAGGEYAPVVSAGGAVGDEGYYTWGTTAQMVADVQSWLDDPAGDFGWVVIGNEGSSQTAKRFGTRENPIEAYRPLLTVTYQAPVCPADLDGDGTVGITDFLALLAAWGPCP